MATVFAPLWYCGARDTAGAAIATGKAYFYVVGSTSTFITIYADALENEPITHDATHPVTLDAGGRAKVFLKTPAKVVITDADDVVKQTITEGTSTHLGLISGTWDGVDGTPTQDALTAIEASLGANAKYLLKSGATARLYHDVVAQFVTPKDYAAVGDGTADDTTPLQNAIDAAISLGIPLNLEHATYKITAGLTAAGIINIYGAGMSESIITTTATGITGLTIAAASGSYLRDFAVHLPYDGTTYDQAVLIGGSTCTVERLDVTGGQGIKSTAPQTRVSDCIVTFKCPNTDAQWGYGVYLSQVGVVLSPNINGVTGDSASFLTEGVYAPFGIVVGGEVSNCRRGGETLFIGTNIESTCTYGIFVHASRYGAIGCKLEATTPFSMGLGRNPINFGNYISTKSGDTQVTDDATDAPSITLHPAYRHHIIRLTYDGTIAVCAFDLTPAQWMKGQEVTITLQTSAETTVTLVTWGGDIITAEAPTTTSGRWASARFIFGNGDLIQATPWTEGTGSVF